MFRDNFKKDLQTVKADPDLLSRTRAAIARRKAVSAQADPDSAKSYSARKQYIRIAAAVFCCVFVLGTAGIYMAQRQRADHEKTSAGQAVETENSVTAAADTGADSVDNDFHDPDIRRYGNYAAIVSVLEKSLANSNYGINSKDMAVSEEMTQSDSGAAAATTAGSNLSADAGASGYSQTNVQVEGVDEADVIKNDGEFIYYLSDASLYVIDVRDPADMKIAAVLTEEDSDVCRYYLDIFYDSDSKTLSVISSENNYMYYGYPDTAVNDAVSTEEDAALPASGSTTGSGIRAFTGSSGSTAGKTAPDCIPSYDYTMLQTYDVSDPYAPKEIRTFKQEGSYLSSRRIGDTVYLITAESLYWYFGAETDARDMIPSVSDGTDSWKTIPALDIYIVNPDYADAFTVVSAINTRDAGTAAETQAVLGSGSIVYASTDTLYIAGTIWDTAYYKTYSDFYADEEAGTVSVSADDDVYKTKIISFSITDGTLDAKASGIVNGTLLNQYSMDEYEGNLRVATTSGGWTSETSNNVVVLNERLEEISSLTHLAPGESIYAARFAGSRIYLVTFVQVDPFFVIDASDPTDLKVVGELKIPGYSNYLQMLGDNTVLAIGNVTYSEGENVIPAGLKIAVFDVTDPENPVQQSYLVYGDSYGYSEVQYNPKALLLDQTRGIIGMPVSFDQAFGKFGSEYIEGYLLLGVDETGNLTHMNLFKNYDAYMSYGSCRGIYIGSTLFLVGYSQITAFSMDDYGLLGTLSFSA